jgi:hypothetical protein
LTSFIEYKLVLKTPTSNPQEASRLAEKMKKAAEKGPDELYRLFHGEFGLLNSKMRTNESEHIKAFFSSVILAAMAGALKALSEVTQIDTNSPKECMYRAKQMLSLARSLGDEEWIKNRIASVRILTEGLNSIKHTEAFRDFKRKYKNEVGQTIASFRLPILKLPARGDGKEEKVSVPAIFSEFSEELETLAMQAGLKPRGLKSLVMKAFLVTIARGGDSDDPDDVIRDTINTNDNLERELAKAYTLAKNLVKLKLE